jgi:hypothetical protein
MTRNDGDSEDLRVKRTHKLLQEAFIELTVQKGFSAVAISDITTLDANAAACQLIQHGVAPYVESVYA